MNRRFFAEFLTLLSRRVNPDPEVEDTEEEEEEDMCPPLPRDKQFSVDYSNDRPPNMPLKPGGLSKFGRKNLSSITLHSKVFDLTFDK